MRNDDYEGEKAFEGGNNCKGEKAFESGNIRGAGENSSPDYIKRHFIDGKDYTSLEACVNLEGGMGLTASNVVVRECRLYEGRVRIINPDFEDIDGKIEPREADGKSILDMIALGALKGHRMKILIEGYDDESRNLGSRIYSVITSDDTQYIPYKEMRACWR